MAVLIDEGGASALQLVVFDRRPTPTHALRCVCECSRALVNQDRVVQDFCSADAEDPFASLRARRICANSDSERTSRLRA